MDAYTGKVEISDAQGLINVIKEQDFEQDYNAKKAAGQCQEGFALPKDLEMADLVEFNLKLMSQVWAQLNPAQFQPGFNQKEEPI